MSKEDREWEAAQERAEEREERNANRCQCGYPDWPGRCPGPANCPCCQPDAEETEEEE